MRKLKHDDIIMSLEQRLKDSRKYSSIVCNDCYHNGETDLYATTWVKGEKRMLIFEVKGTNRPSGRIKAKKQLRRAEKQYKNNYTSAILFYAYGANNDRGYYVERIR